MENLPSLGFSLDSFEERSRFADKIESLPKGTSFWRVAPPFGTNHRGALFHFYQVHWGFVGPSGSKMPVQCSYQSEGFCPVCKRVFEARDDLERAKVSGNDELAKELTSYIKEHSARKSYVYNMIGLDGSVKMIGVPKTAHDALKDKIAEAVYKKSFDPTALVGGVWFEFNRIGDGMSTEYKVDFKKKSEKVGDDIIEKLDRSPLSAETVEQIQSQLKSGGKGLLKDIHVCHEVKTAKELSDIMNGVQVQAAKAAAPAPKQEPKQEEDVDMTPPQTPAAGLAASVAAEMARIKKLQEQSKGK